MFFFFVGSAFFYCGWVYIFGACDSHFHVQGLKQRGFENLTKRRAERRVRKLGEEGDIVRNCLQLLLVLLDRLVSLEFSFDEEACLKGSGSGG